MGKQRGTAKLANNIPVCHRTRLPLSLITFLNSQIYNFSAKSEKCFP